MGRCRGALAGGSGGDVSSSNGLARPSADAWCKRGRPKKEAETRDVITGFPRGSTGADHLRRLVPNRPDNGKVIHAYGMNFPRGTNSADRCLGKHLPDYVKKVPTNGGNSADYLRRRLAPNRSDKEKVNSCLQHELWEQQRRSPPTAPGPIRTGGAGGMEAWGTPERPRCCEGCRHHQGPWSWK